MVNRASVALYLRCDSMYTGDDARIYERPVSPEGEFVMYTGVSYSLIQELQDYASPRSLTKQEVAHRDQLYEKLEQKFLPLLKGAVYHYRWFDVYEDLWQVARWSFYRSMLTFNLRGGVFFEYYCKRKVYGDLRTYTRRIGKSREREQFVGYKLESMCDRLGNIGIVKIFEDAAFKGIEWRDMFNDRRLTERERTIIVAQYIWGCKQKELAGYLHLDQKTIRKYQRLALEKLKTIIKD